MRHGEAEPYKQDDKSRELTPFGVTQVEHATKWIVNQLKGVSAAKILNHSETADNQPVLQQLSKNAAVLVDSALVSPYIRTQQTLMTINRFLSVANIDTSEMVTPMGNVDDLQDYINAYMQLQPSVESMLIVSHMPFVSLLSDKMCSGFNARIFDTADVLAIEYEPIEERGKQLAFYQSLT